MGRHEPLPDFGGADHARRHPDEPACSRPSSPGSTGRATRRPTGSTIWVPRPRRRRAQRGGDPARAGRLRRQDRLGPRAHAILALMLDAGLRISEVTGLRTSIWRPADSRCWPRTARSGRIVPLRRGGTAVALALPEPLSARAPWGRTLLLSDAGRSAAGEEWAGLISTVKRIANAPACSGCTSAVTRSRRAT